MQHGLEFVAHADEEAYHEQKDLILHHQKACHDTYTLMFGSLFENPPCNPKIG